MLESWQPHTKVLNVLVQVKFLNKIFEIFELFPTSTRVPNSLHLLQQKTFILELCPIAKDSLPNQNCQIE